MNDWYVYQHIRKDTGEVFYIGIGHVKNFRRAFDIRGRNDIWRKIAKKTEWNCEILADGLEKSSACFLERELIRRYGRKDINTGVLANMTNGGETNDGRIVSDALRCKLSESRRGVNNPFYGKKHSMDHRRKLSQMNRGENHPNYGKFHSDEARTKISKAGLGRKVSPETREKRSINTPLSKQIDVWEFDTGRYVGRYRSASVASRELEIGRYENIARVARGERRQTHGYTAKYVIEVDDGIIQSTGPAFPDA